ncbi:hypothetical protein COU76_00700 [Candidatus Peregrinibacteria bacterium CG10_big_fil_rev_8_21_14_0_10_49_10]|nr:MAG: hypothetical protein COU76_00700 [Candidatus Peregrinibacteria bacterium CG10_big_fil_rev_8_21_14_0_10_49_10]
MKQFRFFTAALAVIAVLSIGFVQYGSHDVTTTPQAAVTTDSGQPSLATPITSEAQYKVDVATVYDQATGLSTTEGTMSGEHVVMKAQTNALYDTGQATVTASTENADTITAPPTLTTATYNGTVVQHRTDSGQNTEHAIASDYHKSTPEATDAGGILVASRQATGVLHKEAAYANSQTGALPTGL